MSNLLEYYEKDNLAYFLTDNRNACIGCIQVAPCKKEIRLDGRQLFNTNDNSHTYSYTQLTARRKIN